jgi:hypothetical protein
MSQIYKKHVWALFFKLIKIFLLNQSKLSLDCFMCGCRDNATYTETVYSIVTASKL